MKKGAYNKLRRDFSEKNPTKLNTFNELKKILEKELKKSNSNQKIKDYLIYYEIYITYYQYVDHNSYKTEKPITTIPLPDIKNIYFKRTDERKESYYYGYNNTVDIAKNAKEQMQKDNITRNYKKLFDSFKTVSFETILTDNDNFNQIIKSYIDEVADPNLNLFYLYDLFSSLRPKRDSSIYKEFENIFTNFEKSKHDDGDEDEDEDEKKEKDEDEDEDEDEDKKKNKNENNKIEDYCKITVVNSIDKTGEKPTDYEIYIHLDLMDGIVNSENLSKIKCKYQGKQLGHLYMKHTMPQDFWEIKPLPYLRVDNLLENKTKKNKTEKPNPNNNKPALPVQGGRYRHKTRKNKRKTRRIVQRISRFRNTRRK
jgi:hypothetical protein